MQQPSIISNQSGGSIFEFISPEETDQTTQAPRATTLADFTVLKVLGKGAFGTVFLVEQNDTKKVYAMKCLRKDVVLQTDKVKATLLEKQIL